MSGFEMSLRKRMKISAHVDMRMHNGANQHKKREYLPQCLACHRNMPAEALQTLTFEKQKHNDKLIEFPFCAECIEAAKVNPRRCRGCNGPGQIIHARIMDVCLRCGGDPAEGTIWMERALSAVEQMHPEDLDTVAAAIEARRAEVAK